MADPVYNAADNGTAPRRRTSDQVRNDIMHAALTLFAERGYARTTTKEVASRARSSETLVFRYFTSKARLFEETIVSPLAAELQQVLAEETGERHLPTSERSRRFIERLYGLLSRRRELLIALITTRLYESGDARMAVDSEPFRLYFDQACLALGVGAADLQLDRDEDLRIDARISFATVAALAVFGDWLSISADGESAVPIDGLVRFVLRGIGARQPDASRHDGQISPASSTAC